MFSSIENIKVLVLVLPIWVRTTKKVKTSQIINAQNTSSPLAVLQKRYDILRVWWLPSMSTTLLPASYIPHNPSSSYRAGCSNCNQSWRLSIIIVNTCFQRWVWKWKIIVVSSLVEETPQLNTEEFEIVKISGNVNLYWCIDVKATITKYGDTFILGNWKDRLK